MKPPDPMRSRPTAAASPDTAPVSVSAQSFEPGQGGICRVARTTVKALAGRRALRALAVEDRKSQHIDGVDTEPFEGSRARFVIANTWQVLAGRRVIYDFPGTARAHVFGGLLPRPYAVWIHGIEMWEHMRPGYARAVRAADLVLVNSRYTLEKAERYCGPIPNARLCWLGTEQDGPPATAPDRSGPPLLLFVGRSDELFAKGQDLLVAAWPAVVSKVPDARLVFAGGGNHLATLRQLADGSPARANIDVLGFVAEEAMEPLWRRATIFAMPGYLEGFGLVFVEAMRHRLPVIASTDDASCEINVDGVTGFNVGRSDRDGLVDRIVLLLSDRDRAARMGEAGFARWRENFRFAKFKERLTGVLRDWR
jgi:phosphatidylinositol alpha-1,6-mannosyltransferase